MNFLLARKPLRKKNEMENSSTIFNSLIQVWFNKSPKNETGPGLIEPDLEITAYGFFAHDK